MDEINLSIVFEPSVLYIIFIFSLSLSLVFYDFKKERKNILFGLLHLLIIFSIELLIQLLVIYLIQLLKVSFIYYGIAFYISIALTTTIYVCVFNKYNWKAKLGMSLSFYTTLFILNQLSGLLPKFFSNVTNGNVIEIFFRFFVVALIIPYAIYIHICSFNKLRQIHTISLVFIGVYTVLELVLTLMSVFYSMAFTDKTLIFATEALGTLFIVNILSYYMIYYISLRASEVLALQIKTAELEKNESLVSLSEKNLEEMRKIRHDIKNQYSFMKVLLNDNKYDELKEYFNQLGDGIIEPLSFIDCENRNVSAVLNMELTKARSQGVDFDIKIAIPKELPFSSVELCSLFSNIIDNAIEACLRYNIKKPIITIKIRYYSNALFVRVENPLPNDITIDDIKKKTTMKADTSLHGYGSGIVNQIVKTYNGVIKRYVENGSYVVDIMLTMEKKELEK